MLFLKREDSLKMSVLFNLMGITRMEERFLSTPYKCFTDTEKLLIKLEEERRDNYIKKAMRNIETLKDKDGLTFTVVFAESYASELGNYIISEDISDYVMLIMLSQKKYLSVQEKMLIFAILQKEMAVAAIKMQLLFL